jgi:aldehyde:ferredoxin oxidoreductase
MDTISAGVTVAWAMECFDRGLLSTADTGGIELRFGNEEALLSTLRLISDREGIGDLLAAGSRAASEVVGRGSDTWAMHVKGLEMPGYEPRSLKTMALGLAVSTRGACHNRSSAYEADFSSRVDRLSVDDQRGRITMEGEDFSAVLDSLIWCKFLRKAFDDLYAESAEIYELVTGWEMTPEQLRQAGERINNLKKLFNVREGWVRDDDTLPPRVLQEELPTGMVQGVGLTKDDLDMMIAGYYRAKGWTADGLIPDGKIRELDLVDVLSEPAAVA